LIKWLILPQLKDRRRPIKEDEDLVVEDVEEEEEDVVVTEEEAEGAEVEDLVVVARRNLANGFQSPSSVALLLTS